MLQQNEMHTVLGANGAMGMALADELRERNLNYRLISRKENPKIPKIEKADLLNKQETLNAIEGSKFVYLCIGLPYNSKIWSEQWPIIMQNVIEACSTYKSKLIFFDNVYLYSNPLSIPFDESMEQNPMTNKGKTRKQIADLFLNSIAKNKIEGLIARSADFYGSRATNSILYISILEKMLQKKNPQSLSNGNITHTYSYLEDNARAILDLSLCQDCYGEVWHLPVSKPITLDQVVRIFNEELNTELNLNVMPKFIDNILSKFIPIIKEAKEMQYQFDSNYEMSYKKFAAKFPKFEVTPIEKGLKEMANFFKNTHG